MSDRISASNEYYTPDEIERLEKIHNLEAENERLLARIEALTLAGDGLAECVIPYRSNATRVAAWEKAKE